MDEKERDFDNSDHSTPDVRPKGRGGRQNHRSSSSGFTSGRDHSSHNSYRYSKLGRGISRQRGDFEQDSSYQNSNSSGYASNYKHSRGHRKSHGWHSEQTEGFKDHRSKDQVEKELNKLSLLDGIQEMYKKPNQDLNEGATGNDGEIKPQAHKKIEDEEYEDVSERGNSKHTEKNRWKKEHHHHRNRAPHFGDGHKEVYGTYRSYNYQEMDKNQDSFEASPSFSNPKYNKRNHHAQPSAPPYTQVFDESQGNPMPQDHFDRKGGQHHKGRGSSHFAFKPRGLTQKKPFGNKGKPSKAPLVIDDDATQREMLTTQLEEGEFECMVCCEAVRRRDPVWSCQRKCYNMFHLHCIRKWARTPTAIVEGLGWRCPTCQDIYEAIPHSYYCFCGKVRDPEMSRHDTPHSCGQVCGRKRQDPNCQHKCNLLCHPGPCPSCETLVTKNCPCGKLQMQIRCGRSSNLTCEGICDKLLNCEEHKCKKNCHSGACEPCEETVQQDCFCGKSSKEVICTTETSQTPVFCCEELCQRRLKCENHFCQEPCHPGDCGDCKDLPEMVTFCPCGSSLVKDLLGGKKRTSCIDPIPTCRNSCHKQLRCGPKENHHQCYSSCHDGECPSCPLKTWLSCQCGSTFEEILCAEIAAMQYTLRCKKRCNSKKQCGRHKCLNTCCIDSEHNCELTCNRKLTCGLHQCPLPCHKGNCHTCFNVSFEDLACECGAEVILAPIACGTKPPECNQICSRIHHCDHPVHHKCHSDDECTPCTNLTDKWCFGNHEKRSNVPCHINSLSCGLKCSKPLPCGSHVCQKVCHEGPCHFGSCVQPCTKKRPDCEHTCSAPCHEGPCPSDFPCKTLIKLSCKCGNRWEEVLCYDNTKLFKQVSASLLASKMQDIQLGNSVDISDLFSNSGGTGHNNNSAGNKKCKTRKIECNEECAQLDRNRRLALALQIRNPDLSTNPGPPKYTDFLKDEMRKSPAFVMMVHDKLTELVQLAKQSKQKSRSHSFQPGNRDQRRVVHELCEFFGCQGESFDQEPKRNVVVTAFRDRSFLPSCSIMRIVQREMGMRTVPLPVLSNPQQRSNSSTAVVVNNATTTNSKSSSTSSTSVVPPIDYFDFCQ